MLNLKALLELIFPVVCFKCARPKNKKDNPDGWLCLECQKNLPQNQWVFCPVCSKKETCLKHQSSLEWLGAPLNYNDQTVKKLIWQYKYGFSEEICLIFSSILSTYLEKIISNSKLPEFPDNFLLTAIPLTTKRQRWRGFNQSELLAKKISQITNLPYWPSLLKIKETRNQMSLKNSQNRQENIKDVFLVLNSEKVKNNNIILIDDVIASGATLKEAAKILKKAGGKKVFGLAISRKI